MKIQLRISLLLPIASCLFHSVAFAFPSTTLWAPSTTVCQQYAVPHYSFYSFFGTGPEPKEGKNSPIYPVNHGLLTGLLPFEKLQAEGGVDLFYPTHAPLLFNGKFCTPESAWFDRSPGLSLGIYNLGFEKDVNDYNILYGNIQESISGGGYVSIGAYHGLSKHHFTNSDGDVVQTGLIAGIWSPDVKLNLEGLKRLNFVADIQTGKNLMGAWSTGVYLFFTDYISLVTGPVFFFDPKIQPGERNMLWSVQIDIDFPLTPSKDDGKTKFNKRDPKLSMNYL